MTLKNGLGKCSLFVLSANGWKDQRHGLFVFPPKKTLIWRRHCSIGQSCSSMTSKRSIGWFLESSPAWSFLFTRVFAYPTKRHARLCPFDKPIKSLYFRPFVVSVLFARFHFKVIRKSFYQAWDAVFHHQMKHREESWKTRRAAKYFWRISRCFIWCWNTVSNAWYCFSNKMIFEGEIKGARMRIFF